MCVVAIDWERPEPLAGLMTRCMRGVMAGEISVWWLALRNNFVAGKG